MEKARPREMLNIPGWLLMWSVSSMFAIMADSLAGISTQNLGFLQSSKEKTSCLATTCGHAL